MTRLVRRTVSDRLSSSTWNRGVAAAFSTSISWHRISISPEVRLAFSVPAGRRRTLPLIFRTNSLRTDSASLNISARSGSHTT